MWCESPSCQSTRDLSHCLGTTNREDWSRYEQRARVCRFGSAMIAFRVMTVRTGITSLDKLEATDPRVIEGLVNRHAPFGTEVLSHVRRIPSLS